MSAVEMHSMILSEIYAKILNADPSSTILMRAGNSQRDRGKKTMDPLRVETSQVDYGTLISTNLVKKKQIRKFMMAEYANM